MQVLESTVSSQSEDFRTNAEAMDAHITTFRDVEQKVLDLAEAAREEVHQAGQVASEGPYQPVAGPGNTLPGALLARRLQDAR